MGPSDELRCRELVETVTEYLEGTMAPVERIRFEQHLSRCEVCRRFLTEMRKTLRAAGRLNPAAMAPPARHELLDAFREWARQPSG